MSLFLPGKKEQVIEIRFSEDGEGDLFSPLLWIPFPTPSQELATMFELFTPFLIFPTPSHPTSCLEKKKLFKISASRIQNPTHPWLWQKTAHYAFPYSYKPRFSSWVISLLKVIYACVSALSSLISFAHLVFRCCLWFYSYPPPVQQGISQCSPHLIPYPFPQHGLLPLHPEKLSSLVFHSASPTFLVARPQSSLQVILHLWSLFLSSFFILVFSLLLYNLSQVDINVYYNLSDCSMIPPNVLFPLENAYIFFIILMSNLLFQLSIVWK